MLGTHALAFYFFMLAHASAQTTDEALFKLHTLLRNTQCVTMTKYDSTYSEKFFTWKTLSGASLLLQHFITHLKNKKLNKAM